MKKILELGSGPGTDWEMLSSNKNNDVVGSNSSKVFLTRLQQRHPNGTFLELNATTMTGPSVVDNNNPFLFDAIYSNKVLHHLRNDDLAASLHVQAKCLNSSDGLICHSFWADEGEENYPNIGMYVNYHTREELEWYFKPHFEILLLEAYQEFEKDDSFLVIGRKK